MANSKSDLKVFEFLVNSGYKSDWEIEKLKNFNKVFF